jgi:hypothetical protein
LAVDLRGEQFGDPLAVPDLVFDYMRGSDAGRKGTSDPSADEPDEGSGAVAFELSRCTKRYVISCIDETF